MALLPDNSAASDSSAAIEAVDELLAGVGLERRGRVSTKTGSNSSNAARGSSRARVAASPASHAVEVVRAAQWAQYVWLMHGFSTRTGGRTTVYRLGETAGELNLGFTASDPEENVIENRRTFVAAVAGARGRKRVPLVTLKQIHSSLTRRVGQSDAAERAILAGDGLMTDEPGILLGIQTADCIPILIADRKKRAVAAFHAGWRGTLKRIVETGVGRMRLEFRSRPEDLIAAIGPGIGLCCYSVGEEVRHEFESQFAYAPELFRDVYDSDPVKEKYPLLFMTARAPGHSDIGPSPHLDLAEANRRQLLDAGVKASAITVLDECTSCQPNRFFSHREQRGFTGRLLSVVGVRG